MASDVDARIDRATRALGVELLPWQRRWLQATLNGERIFWHRGRRGGWSTVKQVASEVASEAACPACEGAMPAHQMGMPLQVAHRRHQPTPAAPESGGAE